MSRDDLQLVRRVVEALSAFRGHGDDVLDADTEAPGEVDAGSIEKHMPGWSSFVSPSIMYGGSRGQPDAVSGSVDEVLAVTGVVDHLARHAVDLLALDARPHRLEGGALREPHELVDLAFLVGRLADVDGASRVRA